VSVRRGGAGHRVKVTRVRVGDSELAIISEPLPASAAPGLTRAEREVCEQLLLGASNAEIAAWRGTSARTVANQVASIFAKLGVSSRAELAASCLEGDRTPGIRRSARRSRGPA
jgi:DNA-binding CsgD family transcriptional regulator